MFSMLRTAVSWWAYVQVMLRKYWNLLQLGLALISKSVNSIYKEKLIPPWLQKT